jgi:hypothetical protein
MGGRIPAGLPKKNNTLQLNAGFHLFIVYPLPIYLSLLFAKEETFNNLVHLNYLLIMLLNLC